MSGYTFTFDRDALSKREQAERAAAWRSVHRLWPAWLNNLGAIVAGAGVGVLIPFAWHVAETETERWIVGAATALFVGGHYVNMRVRNAYARRAAGAHVPTSGPDTVSASPEGLRVESMRITALFPWPTVSKVLRMPGGIAFVFGAEAIYVPDAALPPHPPAASIVAELEGWRTAA